MRLMRPLPMTLFLSLAASNAAAQPDEPPVEAAPVETEPVEAEPTFLEPAEPAEPVATTAAPAAVEADWADPSLEDDAGDNLQIHGWVSQGVMASTGNNYLANTTDGSFEFFEAGLNVTKELGTNLRTGVQIFAQDLGPIGNYEPIIDWAYIDYRKKPWLGIRAGRFKMPLYLYNERMDADMTRTTVLMPQAVYDQHFRDVLNAVSGVDVYGTVDLGAAGSLDYDVYAGTVFIQPRGADYELENVIGTRLIWDAPTCLRASAHGLYTNFSASVQLDDAERDAVIMAGGADAGWDGTVTESYNNWKMLGGALECATDRLTLTAEAGIWDAEVTQDPMLGPPDRYRELRAYTQADYRVSDRLSAALYLSVYGEVDGTTMSTEHNRHQYDVALSARYDVTANWLVKAEAHVIDGFGLTEWDLNRGRERVDNWGMFLAKTTLTF
jgi:hypothetical protein